jgi:DNA gyrase subunit A
MQCSERNGSLVGALEIIPGDEVMLISNGGTVVRTATDEISTLGRNTQGVRVIRLKKDEKLIAAERIAESEEDEYPQEATEE